MTEKRDALTLIGRGGTRHAVTPEACGAKAAELQLMSKLGLNVPPAFVLSTALCAEVNAGDPRALHSIEDLIAKGLHHLEQQTGRRFGDARKPLLVSVRSGAARSMPGMLETVLDVGMNDVTVLGLMRLFGNPRLAFDSYRRFVEAYCEVVAELPRDAFEAILKETIAKENAASEAELDPEALENLTRAYLTLARETFGKPVPADPVTQVREAVAAVYRSWEAPKAREYRKLNGLENLEGTAVTIQAMVFGNAGFTSGAGVAFSRNPATGEKGLYADFLFDAQGEDVVSGRRQAGGVALLEQRLPDLASQLKEGVAMLETACKDMQDVEFTIESGELYFLQTRAAKRTPRAALKAAVDLLHEGLIDEKEALRRVEEIDLHHVGVARFAGTAQAIAEAIPAAPGTATGQIAFDSETATAMAKNGTPVILIRPDIATDDVAGIAAAAGIVTAIGGRTAHAAVVARQLGKVCLVGCRSLVIDISARQARLGDTSIAENDWLSLDGNSGEIFLGRREIIVEEPQTELAEIARWKQRAASRTAIA
jgi:pyruvate,orthophosphate dikinase